jgi:hypothetical protein
MHIIDSSDTGFIYTPCLRLYYNRHIMIKYRFRPVTVIHWFDTLARHLGHFVACVAKAVQWINVPSCPAGTSVL